MPTLIGTVKQFPSSGGGDEEEGWGAQSFSQMRTSANVNAEEKEWWGRWDEQEAEESEKCV